MKTIMVTGCAGYIGSNLTGYLLNKGYRVIGIDNFNNYYDPKIKEFNISDFKDHPNFKLYRVDITDRKNLLKVFEKNKLDAVVHMAAWPGVTDSNESPNVWVYNNVDGTTNLAEFAVKKKISNFIFASTCTVYGNNPVPNSEDMNTDRQLAIYPATKKACEVLLYVYSETLGLNVTIFRFYNPLGPRISPSMALPKLVRAAEYGYEFTLYQGTGSSRDYVYIGDMMDAVHAVIKKPFKYEIMNLGNSVPIKLQQLLESVERVTKKKVKTVKGYRPGQMQVTAANIDKARRLIGYNPSATLDQVVEKYYNWFLKQPDWYKKGKKSWMK